MSFSCFHIHTWHDILTGQISLVVQPTLKWCSPAKQALKNYKEETNNILLISQKMGTKDNPSPSFPEVTAKDRVVRKMWKQLTKNFTCTNLSHAWNSSRSVTGLNRVIWNALLRILKQLKWLVTVNYFKLHCFAQYASGSFND